jgi:hypothetical protein
MIVIARLARSFGRRLAVTNDSRRTGARETFMKFFSVGLVLCVAAAVAAPLAQQKYGVTVVLDKKADLATFKSYSWGNSQPAATKSADDQIVAAIDKELKALGMTKVTSGPGDVQVAYTAVRRTDVDPKAAPTASGGQPQYAVGTLSVILTNPTSKERILELRLDKPIDTDASQAEATLNAAVAELFTRYPTKKK